MGQFVSLVIFIVVLAFISVFLDRHWQAYKQKQEGEATVISTKLKTVLNRFKFKKVSNLTEQFQSWVKDAKLDKELKAWLEYLPDDEAKVFGKGLATYCAKLDFNLAWLGESTLDKEPELKKLVETSVISYCTTQWNVAKANEDITLLKTWLTVQQYPYKKKHQQLYRKLFATLLDKKLIKVDLTGYIYAEPEEKMKQTMEFVNQVAEDNRKAFNAVLKEVLTANRSDGKPISKEASSDKTATASAGA